MTVNDLKTEIVNKLTNLESNRFAMRFIPVLDQQLIETAIILFSTNSEALNSLYALLPANLKS